MDASAELSDREKFVRALSRDSAEGAPRGENREKAAVSCVGDKSNGWVTKLIISAHSTFEFTYRSRDLGVAIPAGKSLSSARQRTLILYSFSAPSPCRRPARAPLPSR